MRSKKRLGRSAATGPGIIRTRPRRRPHSRTRPRPVSSTPSPPPTARSPVWSELVQGAHFPWLHPHILSQAIQLTDSLGMLIQHHRIHDRSLKFLGWGGGIEVHFLGGHAKTSLEGAENRDDKIFECHGYFVRKKRGIGGSLYTRRARFTAKWGHLGVVVRCLQIQMWR
jgi:hypothetical protein